MSSESEKRTWVQRYPLVLFFTLAYILTWIIALPVILSTWGIIPSVVPKAVGYLGAFGPLLAAFIVTALTSGKKGVQNLVGRMFKWRVSWIWWLVALSAIFLFAIGLLVDFLALGVFDNLILLGFVDYMPYITFVGAWLFWFATYGLGEETGWRGYALPKLQTRYNALVAALVLSILWAGWHMPFFLYRESLMSLGIFGTIMWVVGLMFGSVFLAWLYNSSKGSILMTAIWHATFNLFTASPIAAQGMNAMVINIILMIWVVIIVVAYRPKNLAKIPRQTLPKKEEIKNE